MNRDFRDLLSAFSEHEVRFLIVGGYAVAFHARPRFTKDLDLWVEPEQENSARTWNALRAFGAPLSGVTPADFVRPDIVYQVGVPPNRVDVLTEAPGVSFTDAWSRRVPSRYGDVPVHYLSREDLITNKRIVGRPQDLLDVDVLERLST